MLSIAKRVAINLHQGTNHYYDKHPYEYHLQMVVDEILRFKHLVNPKDLTNIVDAGWLHDTIEDTRIIYNDVKNKFGIIVADLVYSLTNEKGKTRKERANRNYYKGIRVTKYATLIKLCDRIANVKHGLKSNSKMVNVYKKENLHFIKSLKKTWFEKTFLIKENNYQEVIDYLNNLL